MSSVVPSFMAMAVPLDAEAALTSATSHMTPEQAAEYARAVEALDKMMHEGEREEGLRRQQQRRQQSAASSKMYDLVALINEVSDQEHRLWIDDAARGCPPPPPEHKHPLEHLEQLAEEERQNERDILENRAFVPTLRGRPRHLRERPPPRLRGRPPKKRSREDDATSSSSSSSRSEGSGGGNWQPPAPGDERPLAAPPTLTTAPPAVSHAATGLRWARASASRSSWRAADCSDGEWHPRWMLQSRAPVHFARWYAERRRRWAEWLEPLEAQELRLAERIEQHFSAEPTAATLRGSLAHIGGADEDGDAYVARRFDELPNIALGVPLSAARGSPVCASDSHALIWNTVLFRQRVEGTCYPLRCPADRPEECLESMTSNLAVHGSYLRVRTTMPGCRGDGVEYVHGSLDDVADWNRWHHLYDALSDVERGPTLRLLADTEVVPAVLSPKRWGERVGLRTLALLSALTFPSVVDPGRAASAAHQPWRDAKERPPGVSEDELALFSIVHAEQLSVRAASLCGDFLAAHLPKEARAAALDLCRMRYWGLRRMQSLVASFGEFMFSPQLFNVQYRPLRVEALRRWSSHADRDLPRERLFSADGDSWPKLDGAFVRDTLKYCYDGSQGSAEAIASGEAGSDARVLYALLMARSIDSLSTARNPAAGPAGEEQLADALPEVVVVRRTMASMLPLPIEVRHRAVLREGGRCLASFDGFGDPEASGERERPWAFAAPPPLFFVDLYQRYADECFRRPEHVRRTEVRRELPWTMYTLRAEASSESDLADSLRASFWRNDRDGRYSFRDILRIEFRRRICLGLTGGRRGVREEVAAGREVTAADPLFRPFEGRGARYSLRKNDGPVSAWLSDELRAENWLQTILSEN